MLEVNGQNYQLATTKAAAVGTGGTFQWSTLEAVNCVEEVPVSNTHDGEGEIDGRTVGKKTLTASVRVKLSEWWRFITWLGQQRTGDEGIMQVAFDVPVTYGNSQASKKTLKIKSCCVNKYGIEVSGDDATMVEIPLNPLKVEWPDGIPLVKYSDK